MLEYRLHARNADHHFVANGLETPHDAPYARLGCRVNRLKTIPAVLGRTGDIQRSSSALLARSSNAGGEMRWGEYETLYPERTPTPLLCCATKPSWCSMLSVMRRMSWAAPSVLLAGANTANSVGPVRPMASEARPARRNAAAIQSSLARVDSGSAARNTAQASVRPWRVASAASSSARRASPLGV